MRRLIFSAAAVVCVIGAAVLAQAQTVDHPGICPPLDREWRAVANGTDLAAMDRVIARIPAACPNLRADARRTRAERARQTSPPATITSPATPREPAVRPPRENARSLELTATFQGVEFALSGDKRRLAIYDRQTGNVAIIETSSWSQVDTLNVASRGEWVVNDIALSANGGLLAVGRYDGTVEVWDTMARRRIRVLRGHTDWVTSVQFSHDGRLLASTGNDDRYHFWRIDNGSLIGVHDDPAGDDDSLSFAPNDAEYAALGTLRIEIREVATGRVIRAIESDDRHMHDWGSAGSAQIRYSPDGSLLATTGLEGVNLWSASTGAHVRGFLLRRYRGGNGEWVRSVAFSEDGRYFAVGTHGYGEQRPGSVRIWDLTTGNLVARTPNMVLYPQDDLAFSAGSSHLIVGEGATTRVWAFQRSVTEGP